LSQKNVKAVFKTVIALDEMGG